MGFPGCLEAIKAPTSGKTRKTPPATWTAREKLTSQLSGTSAARASMNSTNWATSKATESVASDQARREAARAPPVRYLTLAASISTHSTGLPSLSRYGKRYEAEVYRERGGSRHGIPPNAGYTERMDLFDESGIENLAGR